MNAFVMADAARHIGCRICEVAYIVVHQQNQDCASVSSSAFIPRVRVIKDGAFTTAVIYRQCEDAPYASVCPTHAIRREHGHIFVEQARCIGCEGCMLACSLGAINAVTRSSRVQTIKCGLRWHRETGPVHVEACPTNALQCIDVVSIQRQRLCLQPL